MELYEQQRLTSERFRNDYTGDNQMAVLKMLVVAQTESLGQANIGGLLNQSRK